MTPSYSFRIWPPFTPSFPLATVFDVDVTDEAPGFVAMIVSGKAAQSVFANESGGHRFQRIPPTEKRGRVQTSTITVAVLPLAGENTFRLNERDLDIKFCRGSGNGGQHRNKTDSACQVKHIPTGLMVRCESRRQQGQNKALALQILAARLSEAQTSTIRKLENDSRKDQIGLGMRGSKRRTIRVRDDSVEDHVTGRVWRWSKYVRGDWE